MVAAIGFCVWSISFAGYFGVSRLITRSGLALQNLSVARAATELTPGDAHAHRAHAALLNRMDASSESVLALEQAIALRPNDYTMWVGLGLLRDKMGDSAGALAALDEAVKHAPYYAHPRWQRGNVLLRAGKYEAAFQDLNIAAHSNPELVPNIIDLAWNVSKGDVQLTSELVDIKNDKMRLEFARFLARQGKSIDAIGQMRVAGAVDRDTRRAMIAQLLEKRAFSEAFQVWSELRGNPNPAGTVYDGGFEGPLSTTEIGFGWLVPATTTNFGLSVDPNDPHTGARSLRIEFRGDSAPGDGLISQLILVEPSRRYRVNFAARTRDIVTGGRPIALVTDASGNAEELGRSKAIDEGTNEWGSFSFEFSAKPETRAVLISMKREGCTTSPCPIFGSLWLDSFSIEPLN